MAISIVSIFFIITLGATLLHNRIQRAGLGENPTLYNSHAIQGIVSLFFVAHLILWIVMLFLNWWITLLIFLGAIIIIRSHNLIRIFEFIVIIPIYKWVERKMNKS